MVISMFEKRLVYSKVNTVSYCVVVGIVPFILPLVFSIIEEFYDHQVAKSTYLSAYNQIFGYVKDVLSSVF